jgi:transposase, IS5 family
MIQGLRRILSMQPRKSAPSDQELFRSLLENMIALDHALVKLSGRIDWSRFDAEFGKLYSEKKGRPGLPTRLMVGLHLLKHMEGVSDEDVCARWVENPYWQYFCGETFFQHRLVLDRSSMSSWRVRIGADQLELLLAETLRVAMNTGALDRRACEQVTVDTTVQTKAVAHPTDAHLLLRAIEHLNRVARQNKIALRQSYLRLARAARGQAARLIQGRGHKQAKAHLRKLRTWTGRLERDIARKVEGQPDLAAAVAQTLELAAKVRTQKAER